MGDCTGAAVGIIKWVLVIANMLFVLVGIAIIVQGAIALKNISNYKDTATDVSWTAIVVIVIGAIVFTIAFLGCCGAIKEQRCLLITYGIISLVILITGVALGIWVLTTSETGESLLSKDKMKTWFVEQYDNPQQTSKLVNNLQIALECCGVNGPMDYQALAPSKEIPLSCCSSILEALEQDKPNPTCSHADLNKIGCYAKLAHLINNFIQQFGILILSVGLFNVLAITFAFCLACHFKDY